MSEERPELAPKYRDAVMAWQQRHFTDYPYLLENWSKFYGQAPFRLTARLRPTVSPLIEGGKYGGKERFTKAGTMDDTMLAQCRKIIKAQASTELGSIQQHRESLYKAQDAKMQFDVLRVMAEEFRHGYQMIYLLASDEWGGEDVAMETIEELLGMRTGTHVLDAFNVYFDSFVDNIVFAAVIDRVGKYQLQMQQVFAYAPMAHSMSPMLSEEAFHLATGVGSLKQWIADAAADRGNVSINSIQRHLNKWIPRGLEMFGDERGGLTNVELGLKSMNNAESARRYHAEVKTEVIDALNQALIRAHDPKLGPEEVSKVLAEIVAGGCSKGLRKEDLLSMPNEGFFRRRGLRAFEMTGTDGRTFGDVEEYLRHLRRALPDAYTSGRDFSDYVLHLRSRLKGEPVVEKELPFFG